MGSEDAACNRLTELALNDVSMAGSILAEAVGSSAFAVAAVASPEAHEAFQKVGAAPALLCFLCLSDGLQLCNSDIQRAEAYSMAGPSRSWPLSVNFQGVHSSGGRLA